MRTLVAITLLLLTGCVSPHRRDATDDLIHRPDFDAARKAAPEWVRSALRTITSYEDELQRRK